MNHEKKAAVLALLWFSTALLYAQETQSDEQLYGPAAFGMGFEANMNAAENFAGGVSAYFDINIGRFFAVGVAAAHSRAFSDFKFFPEINVYEVAALFRWYFMMQGHTGFFVQAEAGGHIASKYIESGVDTRPVLSGGLRGGYRWAYRQFYVEPYLRAGYPYIFAAGILLGVRHAR